MSIPVVIWRGATDQGVWSGNAPGGNTPFFQADGSGSRFGIAAARRGSVHGRGWVAAWRGADADNRIWLRDGGSGWALTQRRPAGDPRTEDRPALTVFGTHNAMAWRGADQDQTIWLATSDTWQQSVACGGRATSTHGPALAEMPGGRLMMAWREAGANQQLFWSIFDGRAWGPVAGFAGGSTHGPALATRPNGDVVMVWKGSGADDFLWTATYRKGKWTRQERAVGRSSHGPALAAIERDLVMVWKGAPGDDRMFWSTDLRAQQELKFGFRTCDTPAVTWSDGGFL